MREPEERKALNIPGSKWEDNIVMDLGEGGSMHGLVLSGSE